MLDDTDGLRIMEADDLFKRSSSIVQKDTNADVIQLNAPTGAGKTLCFEKYMRDEKEGIHKTLLIYPTNALIQSQMADSISNKFQSTKHILKNLEQERGRSEQESFMGLLSRYDIILTNPDIFQAIIGHMYVKT